MSLVIAVCVAVSGSTPSAPRGGAQAVSSPPQSAAQLSPAECEGCQSPKRVPTLSQPKGVVSGYHVRKSAIPSHSNGAKPGSAASSFPRGDAREPRPSAPRDETREPCPSAPRGDAREPCPLSPAGRGQGAPPPQPRGGAAMGVNKAGGVTSPAAPPHECRRAESPKIKLIQLPLTSWEGVRPTKATCL